MMVAADGQGIEPVPKDVCRARNADEDIGNASIVAGVRFWFLGYLSAAGRVKSKRS